MANTVTVGIADLNVVKSPVLKLSSIKSALFPTCANSMTGTLRIAPTISTVITGTEMKIAGGAQMFSVNSTVFNIGERNVAAVKQVLASYRIKIVASSSRTDQDNRQKTP